MLLVGCGASDPDPSLTITPSDTGGTITVSAPTAFSAQLSGSTDPITWTLDGAGTLSGTTGLHTSFVPHGSGAATLTAKAGKLTANVKITVAPTVLTPGTIAGLGAAVTVQYDAQEIPHIQCAELADCITVQGYLQARDRFFPMDFLRHVARSHLAELIGPAGLSQDIQLRTLFKTRAGHRIEDDLAQVAMTDPASKKVLSAFVLGVNAYIAEMRAGKAPLPGEYAQLPFPLTGADIADWAPEDTLAMARLQQFQLSQSLSSETAMGQFAAFYGPTAGATADDDKFQAWLQARQPKTEQAHTLEATPFTPPAAAPADQAAALKAKKPASTARWNTALAALEHEVRELDVVAKRAHAEVGSNNWVVSGALTDSGKAMVANDPHLSLQYPPLFHLSVMTSADPNDNLDLAGGAFPGIPGALVGRGKNVGWGVTVVGYDVTDIYMEKLAFSGTDKNNKACSPTLPCVMFGSQLEQAVVVPESFKVRTAAGLKDAVTDLKIPNVPAATVIAPHHGPLVSLDAANAAAFSARWTGQEGNTLDLKAFFGLNIAHNVDEAIAALKFFATGAQNFVLADDQGNIAYDPHALVPVRNFANPAKVGASIQPPWLPLRGFDGSAEWGDDADKCSAATLTPVPATCWLSDDNEKGQLPFGKNPAKGYFFTANADPLGVSDVSNDPKSALGAFAILDPTLGPNQQPYRSYDWDDSTGFRATQIEQRIQALVAKGKITLADMQSIQADHVSRPGMAFKPFIDAALTEQAALPLTPELTFAKLVLDQWASNGFDCPTGLTGTDPKNSPVDTNATVSQSSAGCFLFHTFLRNLLTNVFTDDLSRVGMAVDGLHSIKAMLSALDSRPDAHVKANLGASFCNNFANGKVTAVTCNQQVRSALIQSIQVLSAKLGPLASDWVWGRVHTIQPVSLLQLVTTNYEPGPYARPGGAFTVDVGNPSVNAADGLSFPYVSGGNVRHISVMDAAAPVVKMQLPGPERDGPTTIIGPDLLGQWVKNTYFDFAFGSQINNAAVSTQTFGTAP
ncbi:MAG TPA: penicillin acylase family protein [Kofleriaceae bacterium]|nr:penicillin acylase family protein [Kofleriaceae bacterium]